MENKTIYSFKTDPDLAFAEPAQISIFQDKCLADHLLYCYEHSPFYRKVMEEKNIKPNQVSRDNLSLFPLTSKTDIENFNDEFQGVPDDKIVDIVMSSGTTGKPTRVMYSDSDLKRLAYNEETSLLAAGITASDTVLLTCTLDRCFIAGLAYFFGIRNIGAAAIRNGQNSLQSHTEMIRRLAPTVVVGVPSFLNKLGLHIKNTGMELMQSVKTIVCIGEPIRDRQLNSLDTAKKLEETWEARLHSTYASSETITSFCECSAGAGGHLLADLGVIEIVDEEGMVLPPGQTGEVVVTPLGITGMPLIRFRTGDISFLTDDPCSCGRNTPRLGPILGRKAQMLKVKGTTLYPQAIFSVLESIEEIEDFYIETTSESELSDCITIHAALKDKNLPAAEIEERLQARLRVRPKVIIETAASVRQQIFNPGFRKPVRFFDHRTK
jgi:phenylacetate-CoA ligase